jgi:hypothetical protein
MNQLTRKLGPLPMWQWIAIGAALGGVILLYRRSHPSGGAAVGAVGAAIPSDAQYNPIDPTTGLPISGGFSTGPATDTGAAGAGSGNLTDLLNNFGALEQLLAGLQEIQPGPAVDTNSDTPKVQTGAKKAKKPAKKKASAKRKPAKHAGHKNPGHHTISHGHGKKTASSSAPHNPRQHHNVQPPSHQKHPTPHHSAQHPAAKQHSNPTRRPAPRNQRHFSRRGR